MSFSEPGCLADGGLLDEPCLVPGGPGRPGAQGAGRAERGTADHERPPGRPGAVAAPGRGAVFVLPAARRDVGLIDLIGHRFLQAVRGGVRHLIPARPT